MISDFRNVGGYYWWLREPQPQGICRLFDTFRFTASNANALHSKLSKLYPNPKNYHSSFITHHFPKLSNPYPVSGNPSILP